MTGWRRHLARWKKGLDKADYAGLLAVIAVAAYCTGSLVLLYQGRVDAIAFAALLGWLVSGIATFYFAKNGTDAAIAKALIEREHPRGPENGAEPLERRPDSGHMERAEDLKDAYP